MTTDKLITVMTATLGRDSLALVRKDLERQTAASKLHWLVIGDGAEAAEKAKVILEGCAVSYEVIETSAVKPNSDAWQYGMLFGALHLVDTLCLCIMDDDNRFEPWHIETLLWGLERYPYVGTLREYVDSNGAVVGVESFNSELFDSNNSGFHTGRFRLLHEKWLSLGADQTWCDRDIQMLAALIRVYPQRIRTTTVKYQINSKRCKVEDFRTGENQLVFETLCGWVFKINGGKEP